MKEWGGLAGVGIGLRAEIAGDLLASPKRVDFLEVVAEACFGQKRVRDEAIALAEIWPVVPHGVRLSLGSAAGIDRDRARRLGNLARDLGAPLVSEHVAFTRAGGTEVGHLVAVPRTQEAVAVVARNVAAARRELPDVPFLLENVAWTLRWQDDAMEEGDFYSAITQETGCDLLLDVANLCANAINAGRDPRAELERYPLDRVGLIHIAGGALVNGFFEDTHTHPVPDHVFSLLEVVLERCGSVPILLERDGGFPEFAELGREIDRTRALQQAAPRGANKTSTQIEKYPISSEDSGRFLAARQAELAYLLTAVDAPSALEFDHGDIVRTRRVLRRKRVDEALILLPRLSARKSEFLPRTSAWIDGTLLGAPESTVADAFRIADALALDESFAIDAQIDRLTLRARLVGPDRLGKVRGRHGPFVGSETLPGGRRLWALKGLGVHASVRLFGGRDEMLGAGRNQHG